MSLVCIVVALAPVTIAAGGRVPGPSTGGSPLRYVRLNAELTPPEVAPGQSAKLAVSMLPRDGYAWRDARLVPPSVAVKAPGDWRVAPAEPPLSPIGSPKGRRGFSVDIIRGRDSGMIDLAMRFACVSTSSGQLGKLFVEEARVQIEVPSGSIAPEAQAVNALLTVADVATKAPEEAPDESASPVLPTVFFACATLLVLAGIAVSMRKARTGGGD